MARSAIFSRVACSGAATQQPWEINTADTFSYFRHTCKEGQAEDLNILVAFLAGRLSDCAS